MKDRCQNTRFFVCLLGLDADGTGTIGENNGCIAILGGQLQKPALGFGSNHQDFPGLAASDIGVTQLQSMQKAGALLADIKCRDSFSPQFMLQKDTGTRYISIRGHGGEYNQIKIGGLPTGPLKGNL